MSVVQAGDINALRLATSVRFEHQGRSYEGHVSWAEDNDSALSHEKNHPGCVSLVLSDGQSLNDLPKTTPVETRPN
ncbi:hypothetical protein DEO23_12240 [Brachybacterium endophyticum]|uniref:Uncharacterized protein n=1 Tax=Brachybacterium endophyticum TaxID=2182385 RepID=A0A2U2RHW3_9MICO|nr:hypothetical protein [Brachybacterium endophyticum]PWH05355.1 hypothetical protein DEO23_12240 [Brachybacterium endophyticum]